MKRCLLQKNAVEVIMALQIEYNLPIDLYIGAHVERGRVEVGMAYALEYEKLAEWLIEQGENHLLCGGVPTYEPPLS